MNEHIKKLADQCTSYNNSDEWMFDKEKFAELIVHECMSCSIWVGKNNTNSVEPVHTAHAINQLIKKRFGVEE